MTSAPDPLISIVTPVRPSGSRFLGELYESIKRQDLPDGSWEWLLQVDTDHEIHLDVDLDDPHVHVRYNGVQQGAAGTRNMALNRVRGRYVRNIDDDDVLPPNALAPAIEIAESDARIGYVTGPVIDLMDDGSLVDFPDDLPPGEIAIGTLVDAWRDRDYFGVVHPTCLFVRTGLVLALGGWTALAGSEDTALLMCLNTVALGWQLPTPVLYYRKHSGQTIATDWHRSANSKDQRFGFIERRVEALARQRAHARRRVPGRVALPV